MSKPNQTAEFKAAHSDELGPDGNLRVCIGGGAGFIGSHIAKRLKEEVGNRFSFHETICNGLFFCNNVYPDKKAERTDSLTFVPVLLGMLCHLCGLERE